MVESSQQRGYLLRAAFLMLGLVSQPSRSEPDFQPPDWRPIKQDPPGPSLGDLHAKVSQTPGNPSNAGKSFQRRGQVILGAPGILQTREILPGLGMTSPHYSSSP